MPIDLQPYDIERSRGLPTTSFRPTNDTTNPASQLDSELRKHTLHGDSTPYYNGVLAICQVSSSTAAPLKNPFKADAVWLPKC